VVPAGPFPDSAFGPPKLNWGAAEMRLARDTSPAINLMLNIVFGERSVMVLFVQSMAIDTYHLCMLEVLLTSPIPGFPALGLPDALRESNLSSRCRTGVIGHGFSLISDLLYFYGKANMVIMLRELGYLYRRFTTRTMLMYHHETYDQ
jgi:hypothetical protein